MKLTLVAIVVCAAFCVASSEKLLASSRQLTRRENNMIRRLFKRQAYNGEHFETDQKRKRIILDQHLDPNCDRRSCAVPNCGKDFISATLPGECCERCVPWEYAQSLGLRPTGPQSQQVNPSYDPYNQQGRTDVYIYGPDGGARVSNGNSIYFDCEVTSAYNQNAQPRWSRSGNQVIFITIYSFISIHRIEYSSNYHTNPKAHHFQATEKLSALQFQMPLTAMLADMNAVLVQEIQVM